LREEFARPKVPPSITSGANSNYVTLSWVIWTLLSPLRYCSGFKTSKDEETRYCCKRKHVILMRIQKLEIIRRL
jgi:hypothetical protein